MIGSELDGILAIFGVIAGITLFVLALVFVAVPLFKGIGWSIGAIFRGIGWLIMHLFEFVSGVLGDILRFIGSLLVMIVLFPLVPLNIVIGRWSAAGHFATRFRNELAIGAACVYRAVLRRPLKLLLLEGLLEGLEQRLPEAMAGSPGADRPSSRTGQFDGYRIIGSLRSGGSGARLYVAEPDAERRRKLGNMPDQVVIKAFALTEGSSLPQIVRESRALECAKQLGHVLDHGMDEHRFFYVMPYHPGEHLGVLTRQFHAECGSRGLDRRRLNDVMSYARDLLATLSCYHKGGLWHKDVKPENVIVHDGRAHLVDLGLVTPLRSAMTLTTHGTEYFRDPEMVRQALRGVKVHQVDGAKFDIYAVGAVLYFMIENTFPAHGGLSRITQHSPDALRWIVRRAMTDYSQRYATADQMLADVDYVLAARDPYAVKPAELPSMGGAGAAAGEGVREPVAAKDHVAAAISAAGVAVASAVSAVGAAFGTSAGATAGAQAAAGAAGEGMKGFGLHAGIGGNGPFAKVGNFDTGAVGASAASSSRRPKITVTNWWTGDYRVEPDAIDVGDGAPRDVGAATFRRHASAFRHQASDWRQQVRDGTMSARKAAREQIRAARERAQEMRARAAAHRQRVVVGHPSASPWLVALGVITLLLLVGAMVIAFTFSTVRSRNSGPATVVSSSPKSLLPVLLVVDGADPANPKVAQRLDRIIAERKHDGYDVITSTAGDAHMRMLINQWWTDKTGPADEALEDIMAQKNAYGILHVVIEGDARRPVKTVREQLVHSTRPDAGSRRRLSVQSLVPAGPAPELPYLLINDHPAKTDPKVEQVVLAAVNAYAERGWQLQTNDNLEVQVRKLLPPGMVDKASALPPMLREVLVSNGLGGVVRIDAMPGDGAPEQRVIVTIVNADDISPMEGGDEPLEHASHPDEPEADSDQGEPMTPLLKHPDRSEAPATQPM